MIVQPDVDNYLKEFAPVPNPILEEMEAYGKARNFPIVGPMVGRLLVSLIYFGHVHTILECGSGYGYSAMWMALALPENGRITCIEYDEDNIDKGKEFFEKAGLSHKVNFIKGNSLEIVPELSQTFDLIVNDVNKEQYPRLLPIMIRRLRIGGMLISDNVLWKGKVAHQAEDKATESIQEFNEMLYNEKSLWTTLIPLRDGLSVSIKLRTSAI
ncbi:MAG: methyltransferase domain-containing protein [Calditrichae bacterium]|nr:methyltransferase domain-containing protein [Calditrichia bacterium]